MEISINADELNINKRKEPEHERTFFCENSYFFSFKMYFNNETNLYNGMPASSRNHNTMYTLSRDGGISGHGNEIRFPSTACTSIVRTAKKMIKTHEYTFINEWTNERTKRLHSINIFIYLIDIQESKILKIQWTRWVSQRALSLSSNNKNNETKKQKTKGDERNDAVVVEHKYYKWLKSHYKMVIYIVEYGV